MLPIIVQILFPSIYIKWSARFAMSFNLIQVLCKNLNCYINLKVYHYVVLIYVGNPVEVKMNERILIVEDDEGIVKVIQRGLQLEGYKVDAAYDGESGLELARSWFPDLVILDLMLPGIDGLEVCNRLRARSSVPILILTAKETTQDRVEGLDAGADDYLVKPFELDELQARVRALLRRTQTDRATVLLFADLALDTSTRTAIRNNRQIQLTAKEYDLLDLFMRHPRQVLTREMIFDRVWGYDFGGESNVLDVYIRYLRQKLEVDDEIRLIHTVRGVGYVLRETT